MKINFVYMLFKRKILPGIKKEGISIGYTLLNNQII